MTGGGTDISVGVFVVTKTAPPEISDFDPTIGPIGTRVTISGTNLKDATVKFFTLKGRFLAELLRVRDGRKLREGYCASAATISSTTGAQASAESPRIDATACRRGKRSFPRTASCWTEPRDRLPLSISLITFGLLGQ